MKNPWENPWKIIQEIHEKIHEKYMKNTWEMHENPYKKSMRNPWENPWKIIQEIHEKIHEKSFKKSMRKWIFNSIKVNFDLLSVLVNVKNWFEVSDSVWIMSCDACVR
jgi:hypothetical protein